MLTRAQAANLIHMCGAAFDAHSSTGSQLIPIQRDRAFPAVYDELRYNRRVGGRVHLEICSRYLVRGRW